MQIGRPILSICIPTYNRAECLKTLLDNLLPQIVSYGKEYFQLLVSDNASPDETRDVVMSSSEKHGVEIAYSRNDENIGLANLELVVEKSNGEYVLLLGDDDVFSPDFVNIIMPYLCSGKVYGIIHWNRLEGDANCSYNRLYDYEFRGVIESLSAADFIGRTLSSTNFISSLIFNRECWTKGIGYLQQNWTGYNWYARVLHGALDFGHDCLYYYFPLVIQRHPQQSWATQWPYYCLVELNQIFESLDKQVSGVKQKWMVRLHDESYYNMENIISGVMMDLDFYRKYRIEMSKYLNEKELYLLNLLLDSSNPEKAYLSYCRKRKLKKILNKMFLRLPFVGK